MKSILVDAIRQANDGESETKLSDSGSFDTTQEDFTASANQDLIDAGFEEDAEELELMSTTRGLVVPDANADGDDKADDAMPAQFAETMASATILLSASDCVIPDRNSLPSMPKLARYVPVICVAVALLSGAGWLGYQHLELREDASGLGAVAVQSQATAGQDAVLPAEQVEQRFRYLRSALPVTEDEAAR